MTALYGRGRGGPPPPAPVRAAAAAPVSAGAEAGRGASSGGRVAIWSGRVASVGTGDGRGAEREHAAAERTSPQTRRVFIFESAAGRVRGMRSLREVAARARRTPAEVRCARNSGARRKGRAPARTVAGVVSASRALLAQASRPTTGPIGAPMQPLAWKAARVSSALTRRFCVSLGVPGNWIQERSVTAYVVRRDHRLRRVASAFGVGAR